MHEAKWQRHGTCGSVSMLVGKLETRFAKELWQLQPTTNLNSTNTDGVIIDPSRSLEDDRGILAW
jgi:hypothetical protein